MSIVEDLNEIDKLIKKAELQMKTDADRTQLIYLKVKIKSLAQEAKIIRQEERKNRWQPVHNGLHNHRVLGVRTEQRAALIAYGYLQGKPYKAIEPTAIKKVPWERVRNIVKSFTGSTSNYTLNFDSWVRAQTALKIST